MRRFVLLMVVLSTTLSLRAQRTMQVWEGDTYSEFAVNNVDSITFLQSPQGTLRECKADTIVVIKHDTVYIRGNKRIGKFAVSADRYIAFAQGNLQYIQSTQTWAFAEHQYDMIGAANVRGGALADTIDLFGWSTNNTATPFGISTSLDNSDYAGDFVDWGTNEISNDAPNIWRTLNYDELFYIRYHRANADSLIGVARIQLEGSQYVNGLVLLPDSWVCPAGVTFKRGLGRGRGEQAYANHQVISLSDWEKMEAAGAVFLPAAGLRKGVDMSDVRTHGYYWTDTPSYLEGAVETLLLFSTQVVASFDSMRYYGQSVRLVQEVK